jgi:hypothetical protein
MGQNEVTFGIGEDKITPQKDEIWDRTRSLFGTGEVDLLS